MKKQFPKHIQIIGDGRLVSADLGKSTLQTPPPSKPVDGEAIVVGVMNERRVLVQGDQNVYG